MSHTLGFFPFGLPHPQYNETAAHLSERGGLFHARRTMHEARGTNQARRRRSAKPAMPRRSSMPEVGSGTLCQPLLSPLKFQSEEPPMFVPSPKSIAIFDCASAL